MRRLLTFLTAFVLVLVSLGIGVFTADLPFWRRAFAWPPQPGIYLPAAEIGVVHAAAGEQPELDPAVDGRIVEEAVRLARNAGSRALLVMHRGRLQVERYFGVDDGATLMPAGLLARPLAAMAAGVALGEGRVDMDSPVERYLHEWDGQARGRVTLRQLLEDTSGLESGGEDAFALLDEAAWKDPARLLRFATSRGVRLMLGNDLESTALGFRLDHEPGGFHNVSPVNTQLIAVIVERATGTPYEKFLDGRVWGPAGAGTAQLQLDRRAGMPAAHCCWLAAPRDMLRIASLLANDGMAGDVRVLPEGWATTMAAPSRVDPRVGMQLTRIEFDDAQFLRAADARGSAFWVAPRQGLVILDIAGEGGLSTPEVPKLLIRAFGPSGSEG